MRDYNDLIQEVLAGAIAMLLEWLEAGRIRPAGPWHVDKAHIEVSRDWYAPIWAVTFTIDEPPWFGDSVVLHLEVFLNVSGAAVERVEFVNCEIVCQHTTNEMPVGHWQGDD